MKTHVLNYLETSAAANPEHCAVIDERGFHTYRELAEQSQRVGSALARIGARKRGVIVVMDKGFEALTAQFGALYAGGFYVPVDPNIPASRFESIVSTLGNPLVIFDEAGENAVQALQAEVAAFSYEPLVAGEADGELIRAIRESVLETEPVYTLFTSGSTGTPKGVVISHRAVVAFIDSFVDVFGIKASDRIGNQAPFDFDVSTKDIYSSMAAGATLVVVPRKLFMQPVDLVGYLERHQVTVLIWAVAALCLVSAYHALGSANLRSIRMVMFSGEVMPQKHLKAWRQCLPEATFVNLYGPTEITCNCLYHVLDPQRDYAEGLPLGKPFPHCNVILADSAGQTVRKPGVEGELLVSGPSLALGYLGRQDLTDRAFVQNPTHGNFPERVYRTGDVALLDENGELIFRGRKDNQVKYMGHRVELEEVDQAFEQLPGVNRCRCVFDQRRKRLLAFYEGTAEPGDLPKIARDTLPSFMRPTSIRRICGMPLNKNGKVDRQALLGLAKTRA